jgi:hypothetical protein
MRAAEKLLNFIDSIIDRETPHKFSYIMNGGKVILTGIINCQEYAMSTMCIPNSGISSDWHKHPENEIFIWQSGHSYTMELEGYGTIVVSKSRPCYILANTRHRLLTTKGKSTSLIVLIPGSDTFPKGIIHE